MIAGISAIAKPSEKYGCICEFLIFEKERIGIAGDLENKDFGKLVINYFLVIVVVMGATED